MVTSHLDTTDNGIRGFQLGKAEMTKVLKFGSFSGSAGQDAKQKQAVLGFAQAASMDNGALMDQTPDITPARSAFLQGSDETSSHIVDILIRERCPTFASHWSWPMVRPALYAALGYRKARRTTDFLRTLCGAESFDHLATELQVDLTLQHIERMPREGRLVVAANHPTGLADGVAVWDALRRVRQDLVFFANADAIRVSPNFTDVLIPVEWVPEKQIGRAHV